MRPNGIENLSTLKRNNKCFSNIVSVHNNLHPRNQTTMTQATQ